MPPELRSALEARAKAGGRNLHQEILLILTGAMDVTVVGGDHQELAALISDQVAEKVAAAVVARLKQSGSSHE